MITGSKLPVILIVILAVAVSSAQIVRSTSVSSPEKFDPLLRLPTESNLSGDDSHVCPRRGGEGADSCPVKCFRTDPVCGVDGMTYWCGCADAHCAGTRVAKVGFCEVGNGGSGPLSGQALLLVHIVWLILLGIFVIFGLL